MISSTFAQAALAVAILPFLVAAQAPTAKCNAAPKVNSTRIAYQFTQPGAWIENLHAYKNGSLLATRIDVPQVWQIDPRSGSASLVATIPSSQSVLGITDYKPDVFAVVAGNASTTDPNAGKGSWNVWSIDLSKSPAKIEKIVNLAEAKLPNGVTVLGAKEGTLLVADSQAGKIYSVDTVKKTYKTFLSDATTVGDPKNPLSVGVNGVHVFQNTLYYTNSNSGSILRAPISKKDVTVTGQVRSFATGLTFPDDFALNRAGDVFVALNSANQVAFVPACGGASTVLVGKDIVTGPTAVVYDRRTARKDKLDLSSSILYVSTAVGKLIEIKLS